MIKAAAWPAANMAGAKNSMARGRSADVLHRCHNRHRAWQPTGGTISEAAGHEPGRGRRCGLRRALFALGGGGIVAVWAWLGAAVQMPPSPLGRGRRSSTVSPTRRSGRDQNPFGPDVPIDPRQIEEDLAQLKPFTDCVRTYSVDHGLDQIPEIAQRHGLKVMLGLWLSSLPDLSRKQIETAVALANRYPDVIQSVVVGNEVLLRGEMSAPAARRDDPRR